MATLPTTRPRGLTSTLISRPGQPPMARAPWGKSPESPYRFPQHDWITADPANQGSGSSQLIVVNLVFDETSPTTQEDSVLILTFAQPLTNAGGTIALAVSPQ